MTHKFGWLIMFFVSCYFLISIWLCFSRWGSIRLGSDDSRPDYSFLSWISMLFSAGMGIGLLFYGVAEPILHFNTPQGVEPRTVAAAHFAMQTTMFHYGLHVWAIYISIGLSLAYFCYRKGKSLSLRSALYPIFGERIEGFVGDLVDIFAIIGTLFGVATSLGLGAMQVNSGLNHLFGVESSPNVQVMVITVITALATISVVSGLDKGIKILSEFNILGAVVVLLFIFLLGPTAIILNIATETTGVYFQSLMQKMFHMDAFGEPGWMSSWTIFYFAWWLSWAPFVGIFLARISKGRTIREFILSVMLVPTTACLIWFSTFGGTAIHMEIQGQSSISAAVNADMSTAIFHFLQQFPLSEVVCAFTVILVITFFVTSSDSGSLVIDMLSSNGHQDPPIPQRIFWATLEGAVAAALLLGGGANSLKALQTAAVASGLPLGILCMLVFIGLIIELRKETSPQVKIE